MGLLLAALSVQLVLNGGAQVYPGIIDPKGGEIY